MIYLFNEIVLKDSIFCNYIYDTIILFYKNFLRVFAFLSKSKNMLLK